MKKQLLSVLVLFAVSVAFAQTATQTQKNLIVNGKREGYWEITALLKKLPSPWTPDQVVEKGNYTASMKTGTWIEYYQNGKVKSELTFVNNRANGPAKMYFESGQLQEEGTWVGTRWTGPYKLYYENGNVRQQFTYNAMGVRDGAQTYYHPNGKVAIEVTVKNGKEEGWMKEYNTNGELVQETFHTGGVIDTTKTKTYEPKKAENVAATKAPEDIDNSKENAPTIKPGAGEVPNQGVFDGKGFWILAKNGQITFKGTFENYKLIDGEQRIYDENGKLIQIKLFKGGKYAGDGPLPKEEKAK